MKRLTQIAIAIAALALWTIPASAANVVTFCYPGGTLGITLQTKTNGNLASDSLGCVAFDLAKDVNQEDVRALERAGWMMQYQYACSGQGTLVSGSPSHVQLTTPAQCFTATSRVLCTDNTTTAVTSAVSCVPGTGTLDIYGPNTVTDKVTWMVIKP